MSLRRGGSGPRSPSRLPARIVEPVLHLLRFLNLLEPGRPILSITKVAMWLSVAGLALAIFTGHAIDLPTVLAFFTTSSLYAWRRYVMWKTGTVLGENDTQPTVTASPPAE